MGFNNVNFTKIGFGIQNKPTNTNNNDGAGNQAIPAPPVINMQNNIEQPINKQQDIVSKTLNDMEKECSLDNVVALNDTSVIEGVCKKIQSIKKELNTEFVNRADTIDILFLALVSQQHVIMLGEPGTGKSFLIESLNSRITGSKYFQWQLNKTTDPSELFGPFSIKEMENDKFIRKTDNMLPDASIAYLDELTRGNSAVLNSLLSIMNERVFYNDGKPQKTPLMSIFASMNDMPDDELAAFTDRFVFKCEVTYTSNKTDTKKLLNAVYSKSKKQKTTISLVDIKYLADRAKEINISKSMIDTIANFMLEIKAGDIKVSDRKIIQSVEVMKANAILEGRSDVTTSDFECLVHVLQDLNDKKTLKHIQNTILKFANPEAGKIREYEADFNTMIKELGKIEYESDIQKYITSNIKNFNSIRTELTNMVNTCADMDKKTLDKCMNLRDRVANTLSYLNNEIILNGIQYNHSEVERLAKGE